MASQILGKTSPEEFSDRYQILQQLGKKTGRRTLLARDLQTQALVVINKFNPLPSANIKDISQLELFLYNHHPIAIGIRVGIQQYLLDYNSHLSEPELRWLAQELSDWLALPIVKVDES